MQRIRTQEWFQTPQGELRGYIDPHQLRELWFHTGTACNLACDFCLEGSAPGNHRLELIKLEDVRPFIDEALSLGVEQFSFTGGEPFLAKQIVSILACASDSKPCLVLTNGTEPLQRRMQQLLPLREAAHPISFRVSLDHPEAEAHDAGRGPGTFESALTGMALLLDAGFKVSVARQMDPAEDSAAVEQAYRNLFAARGLPEELHLVAFPDFATPGSHPQVPQVTRGCMTEYQDEASRRQFMCAFSKMVVKREGRMQVYACTLVDDDEEYELGSTLHEAMEQRISMKHHRCYSCFAYGASCSES